MSIVNPLSIESPAAYVLQGAGERYLYKGSCRNLVNRLADHGAGRVSRTKNRRPLKLVHVEHFDSYADARRRELFFKTGAGRDYIEAILKTKANARTMTSCPGGEMADARDLKSLG